MSPRNRGLPLAYVAVLNAGVRQGSKAITALMLWGIVADKLGREPTHQEVFEYWKSSSATHYREMAAFRKAFPGETNPQRLWLSVREQIVSRDRAKATAEAFRVVLP